VLFVRECERCGAAVDVCGSCEPGRRYCRDGCSEDARDESVKQAHVKFSARDTEEGLEVHRLEEQERRDRLAGKEKEPGEPAAAAKLETPEPQRVGDHRCHEENGPVQVPSPAVTSTAAEVVDAAAGLPSAPPPHPIRAACEALVEWVLVAAPALLAQAQRRLGELASCPICGRRGRIVGVISQEEWRRRAGRGFR
jgi:hypothetical protein